MPKMSFTTEQIIIKLRQAGALISQGKTAGEACRAIGVSEDT